MSGFSEKEIKEIIGKEEPENKESSRTPAIIATCIILGVIGIVLAVFLPTLKNDTAIDMNKYEISPITDFEYSISDGYATIEKYIGDDRVVVIPEKAENAPVKHIGDNAFYENLTVEEIAMPEGIETIGELAFASMENLGKILLPVSVKSIGDSAFSNCSSLKEITLPESLLSIGGYAFCGCTSLEKIVLPENVTTVSPSCFSFCSALTSVTLSSGTTDIGERAFDYCSALTEISLPETVTSIGTGAFSGAGLKSFTLPSGISVVPDAILSSCTSLTEITLHNSVTEIGINAFSNTAIPVITIPDSVTRLGGGCFRTCMLLREITIPDSVTSIEPYAFANCGALVSVKLPKNIAEIPDGLFTNCSTLTEIDIPESVKSIGNAAFSDCRKLTNIVLPEKLEKLYVHLTFSNCKMLTELIIPDGVTSFSYEYDDGDPHTEILGINFIAGATRLKSIYLPSTFCDENIGALLSETENPSLFVFKDGNENYTIKDGNLYNSDMSVLIYADASNVRTSDVGKYAVIPDSVKEIKKSALSSFDRDVYILMPEDLSGTEYDTKAKIVTDEFLKGIIISDEAINNEIHESISDAYLEIKKTNASFCTTDKIVISKFVPNLMFGNSVYAYISTDIARRHTVHIYPASLEEKYETLENISDRYGQYLETPKTYVSDTLGEYRIRFSTTDYNDEFIETSEIVDYFLISDSDNVDYLKAKEAFAELFERVTGNEAYNVSSVASVEANRETDFETLIFECWNVITFDFELYPSGYYGDNGEKVFTTENGEFKYSVRIVSTKTGEIYY